MNQNRLSFMLILSALVFAPLAFGTVETWSLAILEVLCLLSLALLLLQDRKANPSTLSGIPGILPLSLFLSFILFQAAPLPTALLSILSQGRYDMLHQVTVNSESFGWHPLSVNLKATLSEFLRVSAYAAAYIVVVRTIKTKDRIRTTATVVAVLALFITILALAQNAAGNDRLLWLREAPENARPFGPYINRNHFAGLMVMVFPITLGLAFSWWHKIERKSGFTASIVVPANQQRIAGFLTTVAGAVLLAMSIFLSGSRSGALILMLSLPVFAFFSFFVINKRRQEGLFLMSVIVILILAAIGSVEWGLSLSRLAAAISPEGDISLLRQTIWGDSLHAAKDFLLMGAGIGSFGDVFTAYSSFGSDKVVLHAHNDYLELLVEGGVLGFALMAWFFLAVLISAIRQFPRKASSTRRYIFIGAATGTFAIMIHGLLDFNFQIGANGLYFFILLGLMTALANSPHKEEENTPPFRHRAALFFTVLLLTCAIVSNTGILAASIGFADSGTVVGPKTERARLEGIQRSALRSSALDPFEAAYRNVLCKTELYLGNIEESLAHCERALFLRPMRTDYRLSAAEAAASAGRHDDAERLYEAAVIVGRYDPEVHAKYALWLLSLGRESEGLHAMRQVIALDPANTRLYIASMALAGVSDTDMAQAMPRQSRPYEIYASYLKGIGMEQHAAQALMNALTHLNEEQHATASHYKKISEQLLTLGHHDKALLAIEAALERFPEDIRLLHEQASLHELAGDNLMALEINRKILSLSPENRAAKRAIWRIEDQD